MSTISGAITLSPVDFPAGTGPVAKITVTVTGPETVAPVDVAPDATSVSFTVNTAGDYTGTAQAFDAAGNALGAAVNGNTVTVTVAPTTVTLQVPSALVLSQAS